MGRARGTDVLERGRRGEARGLVQLVREAPGAQRIEDVDVTRAAIENLERAGAVFPRHRGGLLVRVAPVLEGYFAGGHGRLGSPSLGSAYSLALSINRVAPHHAATAISVAPAPDALHGLERIPSRRSPHSPPWRCSRCESLAAPRRAAPPTRRFPAARTVGAPLSALAAAPAPRRGPRARGSGCARKAASPSASAHRLDSHDLDGDVQVAHHAADDDLLLRVLPAEDRDVPPE